MNNSIGDLFKVTTFGESHGGFIGCVIDGCPSGIKINKNKINSYLKRRRPGSNKYVSQRFELDNISIISGIYKNKSTGTPISLIIKNNNKKSIDYSNIKFKFRPGHADLTYFLKYKLRDYRGGGRSSARTTVSLVAAGAIAKGILYDFFNIRIFCFLRKIGRLNISYISKNYVNSFNFFSPNINIKTKIKNLLTNSIKNNNSIGCILCLSITGLFPGIGEPLFNKLDSCIVKSLLDLNAVKSIEIGKGSLLSLGDGFRSNDNFFKEGFLKNDSGGVLGGISTGQDFYFNVFFKPTSSIFKNQNTVDSNFSECKILVKGRHDPCVGLRAAPILETISSIILLDLIMKFKICNFY
ncbi:MAG: chorismate synthase [Candidatus Vidania fulgoroideorum]